ncbi:hypothetical protein [Mesobacillus sp. S13]|uniref:hypothetical protein n=1 Tax=Mesobacillus sp. S13 TaxID=2880221 RepID=UPI001CF341D9|nr:hypothetical protein [Mesobacillus sp. S13]
MRNLMVNKMGQVVLNVSTKSDASLDQSLIIGGKLILALPTGEQIEMCVDEVLEMDLQAYDIETGLPIYNETDINL